MIPPVFCTILPPLPPAPLKRPPQPSPAIAVPNGGRAAATPPFSRQMVLLPAALVSLPRLPLLPPLRLLAQLALLPLPLPALP